MFYPIPNFVTEMDRIKGIHRKAFIKKFSRLHFIYKFNIG